MEIEAVGRPWILPGCKILRMFQRYRKEARHWLIVGITCQLKAPKYVMPGGVWEAPFTCASHWQFKAFEATLQQRLKGAIFPPFFST